MSHRVGAGHVASRGHTCDPLDCLWKGGTLACEIAFRSGIEFIGVHSGPSHEAPVPALPSLCVTWRSSLTIWKHLALFLLLPAPLNVELKGNTIHHLPRGLPFSQE